MIPAAIADRGYNMQKVNIEDVANETCASPSGKFGGAGKNISIALGRKPLPTDFMERHHPHKQSYPCSAGEDTRLYI